MQVTIEETLQAGHVTTALTTGPYLIYSEVLEGARRPLAFLQVVEENFDLIGAMGNTIQFLKATQLSATAASEATVVSSGMAEADKSLSAVSVSVTDIIYSAVTLSDVLKEDYPKINFVSINFRNMGKAVMEYIDALVYSTIAAASGVVTHSASALVDHADVMDALAKMENGDWVAGGGVTPWLILSPETAADIMKDTQFITTERYTTYEIANMVQGELGKFAGCRVLKTSYLDGKPYAFIVFPPNTGNGPVVVLAWKRRLMVKNERQEKYAYTYFATSARAKPVVVQGAGLCRITSGATP